MLQVICEENNAQPTQTVSVADELKKFKELLDMGAISQEEYDAQKAKLLKQDVIDMSSKYDDLIRFIPAIYP